MKYLDQVTRDKSGYFLQLEYQMLIYGMWDTQTPLLPPQKNGTSSLHSSPLSPRNNRSSSSRER